MFTERQKRNDFDAISKEAMSGKGVTSAEVKHMRNGARDYILEVNGETSEYFFVSKIRNGYNYSKIPLDNYLTLEERIKKNANAIA